MNRKIYAAAVLLCLLIITITACGRKALSTDNSAEVSVFEHTFRIRNTFSEQQTGSDYNKTYGDGKGQAIVVYAAEANHAALDANLDHMLPMLAEECGISRQKMETEPTKLEGHEESVLLSWNYSVRDVDAAACGIAIKDEDSMLYIIETSDRGDPDSLKEEILEIAKTVSYPGTYQITKKEAYPYRVENGYVAVTVPEGYECMQLPGVGADTGDETTAVSGKSDAEESNDKATFHTDEELLVIRYTNAHSYEAGDSFFQVKKLDAGEQTLQQKAEEAASKLSENAKAAKPEEKKVRDIWPDADTTMAGAFVWCVSSAKNQFIFEHFFLEVGGVNYYVQICFPENDSRAAEDMRKLFNGVEFVTASEKAVNSSDSSQDQDERTDGQTIEEDPKEAENSETEASAGFSYSGKEPCLTFSGNAEDNVEATENSYYEGSNYVLYLKQGAKVPGNLPQVIEGVMKEEEELFGLAYEKGTDCSEPRVWINQYYSGGYTGLNPENKKVNILIVPDPGTGEVAWSDSGSIMLFSEELFPDQPFDTTYHELAHVLRLRQGPNLGQAMEEGIGLYAQDRISRLENFPTWSMIQYCDSNGYQSQYDASKIIADPEGEFRRVTLMERSAAQEFYHYGFRFVIFLMQTYGPDAVAKVTEVSKKYSFEEKDVDTIVRVIKEAFGENVFTDFGEWIPTGWKAWCDDYCAYMKQFGLE